MGKFFFILLLHGSYLSATLDMQKFSARDVSREQVHFMIDNFRSLEDELFDEQTRKLLQIFQDWRMSGENPVHVAAFVSAFVDHLCIFLEAKKSIWESYWTLVTEDLLASLSVATYFFSKVRGFSYVHSDEYLEFYETNSFVKKIKVSVFDTLQSMFYLLPLEERNREEEYKIMSLVILKKMSDPMFMEQFRESLRDYYHVRLAEEDFRINRFQALLYKLHLIELPLKPRSIKMRELEPLINLPKEDEIYLEFPLMRFINRTLQEVVTIRSASRKNARKR